MLLTVPTTPQEWDIFSLHNRLENARIRAAIQQQHGVNLPEYPLDPIPFDQFAQWLVYHQQSHNDFNGVLRLQSNDLESLDPKNIAQLQAWTWLSFLETQTAEQRLGI